MQKKLIALAVAGAAAGFMSAPVLAQSQVTLYGTFDAGVRHVDNTTGDGKSLWSMNSAGTYNSNRWGMKGSEDLGNSMKANFNLEGGFKSGSGDIDNSTTTIFRRKAIVGLSGGWGALDMGRNYTTIFYTTASYDPLKYKYTVANMVPVTGLDGARLNNDIQYTGTFNGLTIRAEHALGEVAGATGASATNEVGLSYANGPFTVGGAYASAKDVTDSLTTKRWTVGGSYIFGALEVMAGYHMKKADVAVGGTIDTRDIWAGGRWQMSGANALSLGYYDTRLDSPVAGADGKKDFLIVSFVHNLSKRTELYADVDHTSLKDSLRLVSGPNTKNSILGFSVGINHAF